MEGIGRRHQGTVAILDLVGRYTMNGWEGAVLETIVGLWQQGDRKFLLNLAHRPFIFSMDLGDMVRAYRYVMDRGGGFGLFNVHPQVRDLLQTCNLLGVFVLFDTEDAGVHGLESQST